jgi:hypothetical protein
MNAGATWLNDYIQEVNNTISNADMVYKSVLLISIFV